MLETVNASRAFLTIDSGFPLSDLEEALRTNRPFMLDYHPSRVPIMFGADYWIQDMAKRDTGDFIDSFLGDPTLCRLYSALSALDPDTADQIHKDMPAQKAKAYAHVLDFFGAMFQIRDGKVTPPGGARSEKAWQDLVGVAPERGAAFIERLFAKDDGWLASYYDSLARINGPVQDYLTEPDHLEAFLYRPSRPRHQSRPRAPRVSFQHGSGPADGPSPSESRRPSSSSRRPRSLEEHVRQ